MKSNRIMGIVAPKGSGKSYTLGQWLDGQRRVLVFDITTADAYRREGVKIVEGNPADCGREMIKNADFKILYLPKNVQAKTNYVYAPAFDKLCEIAFAIGNCTLVVEEAHHLCTAYHIPFALLNISRLGRHQQCSLVYVTQSFTAVHKSLRDNTDEFWFWRLIEPADVEGVRARCGSEAAERVQKLRKLEERNGEVIPGEMLRWTIERGLENGEATDSTD